MSSKEEADILLRQIKYLTDLINNAREKPQASHISGHMSFGQQVDTGQSSRQPFSIRQDSRRRGSQQNGHSFTWKNREKAKQGVCTRQYSNANGRSFDGQHDVSSNWSSQYKYTCDNAASKGKTEMKKEITEVIKSKPVVSSKQVLPSERVTHNSSNSKVSDNSGTLLKSTLSKKSMTLPMSTASSIGESQEKSVSRSVICNLSKPFVTDSSESTKSVTSDNYSKLSMPVLKGEVPSNSVVSKNRSTSSKPPNSINSSGSSKFVSYVHKPSDSVKCDDKNNESIKIGVSNMSSELPDQLSSKKSTESTKQTQSDKSSELSDQKISNNSSESSVQLIRNNSNHTSNQLISESSKQVISKNRNESSTQGIRNNSNESSTQGIRNNSSESSTQGIRNNSSESSTQGIRNNSSESSIKKDENTRNQQSKQGSCNTSKNSAVCNSIVKEKKSIICKASKELSESVSNNNSIKGSKSETASSSSTPSQSGTGKDKKMSGRSPSSPSSLPTTVKEWNKKLEETKAKVEQLQKNLSTHENMRPSKSQSSVVGQSSVSSQNIKLKSSLSRSESNSIDPNNIRRGMSSSSLKYSITPISDLISENLRKMSRGRGHNDDSSLITTHTSITPISDLIEKNLSRKRKSMNISRKGKTWSKGSKSFEMYPSGHTTLRSPGARSRIKFVKYSPSINRQFTVQNKSHIAVPQMSVPSAKTTPGRYSWKNSQSQVAASVIVSKYKLRKSVAPCRTPSSKSRTAFSKQNYKYVRQGHAGDATTPTKYLPQFKSSRKATSRYDPYRDRRHGHTKHQGQFYWNKTDQSKKNLPSGRKYNRFAVTKAKSRYKFDSRNITRKSKPSVLDGQCLVMMGGIVYRTSDTSLIKASKHSINSKTRRHSYVQRGGNAKGKRTIVFRGVKFQMDHGGKTLQRLDSSDDQRQNLDKTAATSEVTNDKVKRVDIGGVTYIQTKPGTLERLTSVTSRTLASRAVYKSIKTAATKNRRVSKEKTQQFCMFYNRFGKCKRGDSCPYIHDPTKVAVCTRFLRGTCNITDCPFSHKIDKHKMPVCSYFLRGVCGRDNCPYLHVNVNKNAEICPDFLKGFCPLGEKCKKKHTLICQVYASTGHCPLGEKCKLRHKQIKRQRKRKASISNPTQNDNPSLTSAVSPKHKLEEEEDSSIPFKMRKLPTFISLDSGADLRPAIRKSPSNQDLDHTSTKAGDAKETKRIKIKPQL